MDHTPPSLAAGSVPATRRRRAGFRARVTAAVLATAACGGPTESGQRIVDRVEVTPAAATLTFVGESATLTARAKDADGNTLAGKRFAWSSSDPAVAAVSTGGVVTAAAGGTATITATTEGKSGSAAVTVAQTVTAVAVTPEADTIAAGTASQLTAVALDAGSNPVPDATFTWSSSDEAVATVDDAGLVTAVAQGSATVTAESGGERDEAAIVVTVPVAVACGDLRAGSLTGAAELDVYTFDAAAGDRVFVTIVETAGFAGEAAPEATVVAPSGAELGFARNSQLLFTLPEAGSYEVLVQATDAAATGSYNLGLVCLDPTGAGVAPIAPGDVLGGSLNEAGETDLFAFDGAAGDQVLVAVVETGGFAGAAPQATLFAPSGVSVGRLFEANSQQLFTLAETGTYLVRVRASTLSATGDYALGLERLRPPGADTVQIATGDLRGGSLETPGETDLFTFEGADDDQVFLTLVGTSGFEESPPEATVFSPSGQQAAGPFQADSQIVFTLSESGAHVVRVTAATLADTGGYNLALDGLRPLGPAAVPIGTGDLVSGAIDDPGETDLFTFPGSPDELWFVTVAETGGFAGTPAPQVTVFAPSGAQVSTAIDGNDQQLVTLSESGTYVLRVRSTSFVDTGDYNLGLERLLPASPDTIPVAIGDIVQDSIEAAGATDLITFAGATDQVVLLALVETGGFTGSPAPQATLFAPSGAQVAIPIEANTQQQFTLPETGTYVVRVRDNGLAAAGTYTLGVESLQPASSDSLLAAGDLLAVSIDAGGETDLYTFSADADDQLLLAIVETAGFAGAATPEVTVYAPSGAQVGAAFDANVQQLLPIPETGTFVVRVRANTLTATGDYTIGLESVVPASTDASSLVPGDLAGGAVDAPGESDLFTFTADAEDEVLVTVVETSGFAGAAAPNVSIYAPTGVLVTSPFNANNQQAIVLPESGTYVIGVRANDLVTAGAYAVGLEGLAPRSADTVQLALGGLVEGALDAPGETDLITFSGDAGDQVLVAIVATTGFTGAPAPNAAVFAPSGTQIATSFDANEQQLLTLTESGSHVIRVIANTLVDTGTYTVGLEGLVPPSPDTVQTALGGLVSGSIDAPGETDLVTFEAATDDRVFVALVSTSGFSGEPVPDATVYGPSGAQVAGIFEANDQVLLTLPETGTYTIRARANILTGEGTYNVGVEGLLPLTPDTVRLAPATPATGSLDAGGETDLFVFAGQVDDAITVSLVETGGFDGAATVEATLFAPSGAELGTRVGTGNAAYTLPEDGTYVLRVRAAPLTATGTYSLEIQ